ncbi:MAG: chemotaxis protein CheX [Planctomycetaceae bacterium]|nr:chemotaxis protein CheX [Planctomycetaceae bacterium]
MTAAPPSTTSLATVTAQIVNPLIEAALETFDVMLECQSTRKELTRKTRETKMYPVTAVIGLSGQVTGSICVSLSLEATFSAVKRMIDVDVDELPGLAADAVAELANIIAGTAKNKLSSYTLELGLPSVITGDDHDIAFPSNSNPLCVAFESEIGPFLIAFGFVGS